MTSQRADLLQTSFHERCRKVRIYEALSHCCQWKLNWRVIVVDVLGAWIQNQKWKSSSHRSKTCDEQQTYVWISSFIFNETICGLFQDEYVGHNMASLLMHVWGQVCTLSNCLILIVQYVQAQSKAKKVQKEVDGDWTIMWHYLQLANLVVCSYVPWALAKRSQDERETLSTTKKEPSLLCVVFTFSSDERVAIAASMLISLAAPILYDCSSY